VIAAISLIFSLIVLLTSTSNDSILLINSAFFLFKSSLFSLIKSYKILSLSISQENDGRELSVSQKNSNEKKNKGFFVRRIVDKLNDSYERDLEKNDPIYLEPIHKREEGEVKEQAVLVRGSIDVYFLLIVIALALFGAVMAYSASAYEAERFTGDSLFYFKRHLIFLGISAVFTSIFVI
jgi:hypothetical protein